MINKLVVYYIKLLRCKIKYTVEHRLLERKTIDNSNIPYSKYKMY